MSIRTIGSLIYRKITERHKGFIHVSMSDPYDVLRSFQAIADMSQRSIYRLGVPKSLDSRLSSTFGAPRKALGCANSATLALSSDTDQELRGDTCALSTNSARALDM
jgi:hypothetical protein